MIMADVSSISLYSKLVRVLVVTLFGLALVSADGNTTITFNSFTTNNTQQLRLIGGPQAINGNLQLCTQGETSFCAAWFSNQVVVRGFTTEFTFQLLETTGNDGFAFVIQLSGRIASGSTDYTSGMYYGDSIATTQLKGIPRSIAIEIDMTKNPEVGDPDDRHMGVHTNGLGPNSANETARIGGINTGMAPWDTQPHTVNITYDPSVGGGTLTIMYDQGVVNPITQTNFQLQDVIGADYQMGSAWVGFTSANTNVQILNWNFQATGTTQGSSCYVAGLDGSIIPYAGQDVSFFVQTVDQYGYNITYDDATFTVTITQANGQQITPAAVYLGMGIYEIPYNATVSGPAVVQASVNSQVLSASPYNLTIIPGPVNAPTCVAYGSGLDTVTLAGFIGTFYIQLYDAFSNNVTLPLDPSKTLLASIVSNDGSIITNADVAYVENGLYVATYNLTLVTSYDVSISLESIPIANAAHIVNIAPGPLVEANSIAFDIADTTAGDVHSLYVQLRDAFGNNITQNIPATVTLDLLHTTQNVTIEGDVDYLGNGLYQLTYNATVSGIYDLIASINEQPVLYGSVPVVVTPTYLVPSECNAWGDGIEIGIAGALNVFYIQLRDVFSNNITIPWNVTAAAVISNGPLKDATLACKVSYIGYGLYMATYNLTIASYYNIVVTIDAVPVIQPASSFTLIPAATYAPNSQAYGEGLTVNGLAGEVHSFQLQLRDYWQNDITIPQDVSLSGIAYVNNTDVSVAAQFNFNTTTGLYDATYNLTVAAEYILNITIDDVSIRNAINMLVVSPNAVQSYASIAFGDLTVDGLAGVFYTFSVQLRDAYSNNVTVVADPTLFSIVGSLISDSINHTATVGYVDNGVYVATYNITEAETYTLFITINNILIANPQYGVLISPNAFYPPNCVSVGTGLTSSVAGAGGNFNVSLFDVFNNKIIVKTTTPVAFALDPNGNRFNMKFTHDDVTGDYMSTYNLTYTGAYTLTISIGGSPIAGAITTLTVAPADLSVARSSAAGNYLAYGVAGVAQTFTVQLRDGFGNVVPTYDAVTSTSVTMVSPSYTIPDVQLQATTLGAYTVTYTTDIADTYTTTIQINGANIRGSPFQTIVGFAAYDLSNSLPYDVDNVPVAGYDSTFYVQLRDPFGNNVTNANSVIPADLLEFVITPAVPGGIEPSYNVSIDFDADIGAYVITYVTDLAGDYQISINTTDQGEFGGLPLAVSWLPDVTYPPACTVQNQDGSEWNKAIVKQTNKLVFIARDQYSNRRLTGGDEVEVTLSAPNVPTVTGAVVDNHDGSYLVSYFLDAKAAYTLHLAINGTQAGPTNQALTINSDYANNPVPTLLIVACVLGGGILLAVAGFFIYRRYNRLRYELLE